VKVFLKNITFFSAITILGFFLATVVLIYLSRKLVEKCDLKDNTKSLIMGDSHTMWAISDADIDGLQNISWNAESYIFTYAKLRYILNKEHKITEIFLGFSYHNLSGFYDPYIYGEKMEYILYRYIGVLNFKEFIEISANSLFRFMLSPRTLYGVSKFILTNDCVLFGTGAYKPMKETFNLVQMEKRIQEQYYNKTEVIGISEINIRYLHKIVDLCKEKNIKLTMLQTPMHKSYIKEVPKIYIQYFDYFIQSNNLDLFDFQNLELPDSCFLPDADHVNYYGLKLTSQAFKNYYEERNE
jgi:hypothetical protein